MMFLSKIENYVLPLGWIKCCLPDFTHIVMGQSPTSDTYNKSGKGMPFFQGKTEFGLLYPTAVKYCTAPNKIALAGATLLSVRAPVGPTNLAAEICCIGRGLSAIHPTDNISPMFILYLLRSIETDLSKEGTGSTFSAINKQFIEDMEFGLPPLAEQHRIVAKIEELFSELDKGMENLKAARAQLKIYRQALLKHAFEGKLTAHWREQNKDKLETATALQQRIQTERAARYQQQLADWQAAGQIGSKPKEPKRLPPLTNEELTKLPTLPEEWAWVKLSSIQGYEKHAVKAGPFGSALKKEFFVEEGYKIYGQEQVIRDDHNFGDYFVDEAKYKELVSCTVKKLDILISLVGTIGKVLVLPETAMPGIINPRLVKISLNLDVYRPGFFKSYFESSFLRSLYAEETQGTTMDILNLGMIQRLPYPLCSLSEQDEILNIVETRFSVINHLEQTIITALQQSEALRQSILKKAFSGTLVEQDANDEPASDLLARIKAEKAAQLVTKIPKTKSRALPEPAKTNVIPFPVKIPNISATDLHAGIIARAYQLHETSKQLDYYGHVKAEKISHLVESHLGIDLERIPFKDAAGPNDYPHLKKVESRARKAGWFEVRQAQKNGAYVLTRLRGFDGLVDKTANILGNRLSEVDALLKLLLPMNTRQAEIVATLYAGWNNLLLLGQIPSDEEIVYESRENWHTDKLNIERDKFFKALVWMREHGLIPMGKGRYVKNKELSGK